MKISTNEKSLKKSFFKFFFQKINFQKMKIVKKKFQNFSLKFLLIFMKFENLKKMKTFFRAFFGNDQSLVKVWVQYHGKRRFTSLISPPKIRPVRCKLSSGITDILLLRRLYFFGLDIGDTSFRDILLLCWTSLFIFWIFASGSSDGLSKCPGGSTRLSAKNSFIALSKSRRSSARYAASWKSLFDIKVDKDRPIS